MSVPAEKSPAVRLGMPVDMVDDQGKQLLRTRISFISPHVDPDTQTILVKAPVANTGGKLRNAQGSTRGWCGQSGRRRSFP